MFRASRLNDEDINEREEKLLKGLAEKIKM
jgi:hypothetical protein